MILIIIIMYITITVLSIITFGIKGSLVLLIISPLLIVYLNSNSINIKKKNIEKRNFRERKEVEFVSSRDRKKAISDGTKKKVPKKKTTTKSTNSSRKKENNKTERKNNIIGKEKFKDKSIRGKILIIILGFAIFCIFAAALFMLYIVISSGSFDPEALKNQDQTVIYDKDNNVIATLGAQKRESITFDDLPQVLVDALVATEDSRFYQHNGVDMARFMKATLLNLVGQDDAGGASTLTMQTVKNNLTKKDTVETNKIKKIVRKFQDVYLSVFFLEKKYTKDEILEMYVNDSCLGGTVYGVEEASKYYFGKNVSELSLPEAALLAGMYQAPNRYNPYKNPEAATKRRDTVLTLMVRHGYITEEEKKMAEDVSVESMLAGGGTQSDYQGYIDTVIEEVENKTGNNPAQVSMKIYTAMDRTVQDGINKVLSGEDHTWADDTVQAGVAVTNVNDGTIVAIGAGRNRNAGDWNYATQSRRQPGSTAKPIFDYGPGMEYNDFSTYTLFNDEPWTYTNGPEIGNWDGSYQGLITLRQALSVSRNIPALKAFQQVDKKNIVTFVNNLGLDVAYSTKSENYKKDEKTGADNVINEAYSIGGMAYGVTPLDMAEAYASFANGGYHIETHAVTKIEYRSTGETVDFSEEKKKVMSDSTAYLMNNVLKYAVDYGFNGGAKVAGSTVAAKTGTSNLSEATTKALGIPSSAVNDLWTVAYTPEYSVALWYGYEKVDSSHYLSGASAPKDAVMRSVMKYIPKTTKEWEMPSSVVATTIEKETWPAQLPSEYTPSDMVITEYFKKGTQPTEVSQRYAKLDEVTNLSSTKTSEGYKLTWSWKEPDVLSSTYLTKYFSNSVFGKSSANYLQARLNYNSSTLGGNGFGIYVKSPSGNLDRIAFTEKTEYIYHPTTSGNIEIVVKAEYGNFKANASNGVSTTINSTGGSSSNSDKLELTLNDNTTNYNKGSYNDSGIKVTFEGEDVTNSSLITYKLNGTTKLTVNDLEDAINNLESGEEATITYSVVYKLKYKNSITKTIKIN